MSQITQIEDQHKPHCCYCCCGEKGYYDCCTMCLEIGRGRESCGRECIQHTLCDDESSACCRTTYYIAFYCCNIRGCLNWCLPSCDTCHKIKILERGMCDDCWISLLDKVIEMQRKMKLNMPPTIAPSVPKPVILSRYGVFDKTSAKR
jgi:hypothetical protein